MIENTSDTLGGTYCRARYLATGHQPNVNGILLGNLKGAKMHKPNGFIRVAQPNDDAPVRGFSNIFISWFVACDSRLN